MSLVVQITTVGYGDLLPLDTIGDQLAVSLYAFVGIAFVAESIAEIWHAFSKYVREIARKKSQILMDLSSQVVGSTIIIIRQTRI